MCGITGFIGLQDAPLLERMTGIIAHRGPDDEGVWLEGLVGLGHRRLSIIDLSADGRQPMEDVNSRAVIVYNGEVYNFQEIKEELLAAGYRFRSKTDTEVILNAYLAWGEDCLQRFNGMFALAIWDKAARTLFLARDRLGIKPLFFTKRGNAFLFGSEIKSILCWPEFVREVNPRALDYYLTFRYNHLDETLFKNIYKLPPGYLLKVRLDADGNLELTRKRYWDLDVQVVSRNRKEVEDEIAERLERSIEYRLIADVPVGVFLSAGVDSSSITGIMRRRFGIAARTFTVGFDYPGFPDELENVRAATRHFGTRHTEHLCKPSVVSILPRILWHMDELNADPAAVPTYLISQVAARTVKVVLSGEGSDELWGGYERTMFILYAHLANRYAPGLLRAAPSILRILPLELMDKAFKYSSSIGAKGLARLAEFCRNVDDPGANFLSVAAVMTQEEKRRLYGPALKERLEEEDIAGTIDREYFDGLGRSSQELFSRLAYFELKTRLPNDLLAKIDSTTMAHSLEGRVPFLDHTMVEYAAAVPWRLKIHNLREKYILRRAVSRYLPEEIVKRRKDHFFVPIHLWLKNDLGPVMDDILSRERIDAVGFFNSDFISFARKDYMKGQLVFARQLWNILLFMIWHRLYIETDYYLSMGESPVDLVELFA